MANWNTPRDGIRIAGAPDSWGVWFADDPAQPHWTRFLDEAAQAGYRAIELGPWGYLPTDAAQLRAELDKRSLELVGVTVMRPLEDPQAWPLIESELHAAAQLAVAFGVEHLVLIEGMYDPKAGVRELDEAGWATMVDAVIRAAQIVREEYGMTLAFHPHGETFVETEAQIERLLAQTPADTVKLCFDTGHHIYCEGDPVAFIDKHADRIAHLHLKDCDPAVLQTVREKGLSMGKAVAAGVMVEPGLGQIDFTALYNLLDRKGFCGWAVVEQDVYPVALDRPLPMAQRSIAETLKAGFQI